MAAGAAGTVALPERNAAREVTARGGLMPAGAIERPPWPKSLRRTD
jgi:hypothetical protein